MIHEAWSDTRKATRSATSCGWPGLPSGTPPRLARATFARRFADLVGEPPLSYLTWWRMTTAGQLLSRGDQPLAAIARQVGYQSEFAFSKAFKREFSLPPSDYRRQRRAGARMVDA
nr:helix-turn-helix transcriptional regulator [Kibdelosporangium philippinense]